MLDLAPEVDAFLDEQYEAGNTNPTVNAICPSCGRRMNRLYLYVKPSDGMALVGIEGGRVPAVTRSGTVGKLHRPSVTVSDLGPGDGKPGLRIQCHRECGGDYRLRMDRLVRLVLDAFESGDDDLVLGDQSRWSTR